MLQAERSAFYVDAIENIESYVLQNDPDKFKFSLQSRPSVIKAFIRLVKSV